MVYFAFLIFCLISSLRDVVSEYFFREKYVSPLFVLFIFSVTTQAFSLLIYYFKRGKLLIRLPKSSWADMIYLNTLTLLAFTLYFLAINSFIGAALNSIIDYGLTPIVTASVGCMFLGERLSYRYLLLFILSFAGLCMLLLPRIYITRDLDYYMGDSSSIVAGTLFAIGSTVASALYRVSFKKLLSRGEDIATIVFFRLSFLTISIGILLLIKRELFVIQMIPIISFLGLIGFALPLFMSLYVLQRTELKRFGMLLFILPLTTAIFSVLFGYSDFYPLDLGAGLLIILGVTLNEGSSISKVKT